MPELITGYSVLRLDKFVSLIAKKPDPVLQPLLRPTHYQSIKSIPIPDHPSFSLFFHWDSVCILKFSLKVPDCDDKEV